MGYDDAQRRTSSIERAEDSARQLARTAAVALAQVVEDNRLLLAAIAARPALRVERPASCDQLLDDVRSLNPMRANIAVMAASGEVVCAAVPPPRGMQQSLLKQAHIQRLMETGKFTVGEPFLGPITGRWVVPLAYPRRDISGKLIGWVGVALDLERLGTVLAQVGLDPGNVISVVSPQGALISRSEDAAKWVGTALRHTPLGAALLEGRLKTWQRPGLDGVPRLWGAVTVPGSGWTVLAGIDRDSALAPVAAAVRRDSFLFAFAMLLAIGLSYAVTRRIAAPAQMLAQTAHKVAAGERAGRAAVWGVTEIAAIAAEFNAMLDAIARSETALHQRQLALTLSEEREVELNRRMAKAQRLARMGFLEWDLKTNEIILSDEVRDLYGLEKGDGTTTPQLIAQVVHPDDREYVRKHLDLAVRGVQPYDVEHRIVRPDGSIMWTHSQAELTCDADGVARFLLGTSIDITARKQMEEQIRQQYAELEHIYASIPLGLGLVDSELKFVRINERLAAINGRPVAEHLGRSMREVIRELMDYLEPIIRGVLETGQPCLNVKVHGTTSADPGVERDWLASYYPMVTSNGLHVGIVVEDVTERKRAEEQVGQLNQQLRARAADLIQLSLRLLEAQESERRAVARELHDEVGGALTAVKLNLQMLHRKSAGDAHEAALVDGLALVDDMLKMIRSRSLDLRPVVLDDLGLVPALKWYCERQAARSGVPIEVAFGPVDLKPVPQLESACFRIVQEAVTNALRHSGARHLSVVLRRSDGSVTLEVADDGSGFDVAAARERGRKGASTGLLSMEERAQLLGGEFSIDSAPGAGTRVTAEFTLPEDGPG
ncbi:MAG: PAS domain-containing protein [Casimicrobiaceae bacterium]